MNKQNTLIGTCPSHWSVVKFSTVAELKHGYQFRTTDFVESGIKIFKITQIKGDGSIDISSCSYIDSNRLESFEKNILNNGDILMALSGATIGKIGRFKSDEVVLQNYRVGNFIPIDDKTLNKDYFFYFLKTENTYYQILANQNQSAQENVGKEDIHNMLVFLPPLPEQIAIAEVLTSLDDKIDLLHRQNKTLEQMAETLFRQWFVEEAEDGWDEGVISDVANHLKKSVKPQKNENTLFNHYSIPSFDNRKEPILEIGKEIKSNKYEVPANCILFSKLNPHKDKRVWLMQDILPENPICSTEFQVVYPKNENSLYFLYGWLSINENYKEIASGVGGTSGSHQRISPSEIFDFRCPIIPNKQLSKYRLEIEPIYKKQFNNQAQIRTLEKMRDTLLPKLMSGEVKVKI